MPDENTAANGEPRAFTVNDRGQGGVAEWFVLPLDGWWFRWRAVIEITWPNGTHDRLWTGLSRTHETARARALRRMDEWFGPARTARGDES